MQSCARCSCGPRDLSAALRCSFEEMKPCIVSARSCIVHRLKFFDTLLQLLELHTVLRSGIQACTGMQRTGVADSRGRQSCLSLRRANSAPTFVESPTNKKIIFLLSVFCRKRRFCLHEGLFVCIFSSWYCIGEAPRRKAAAVSVSNVLGGYLF